MATDIVMDRSGHDRDDFFSFLAAPHGDTQAALSRVFMSIHPAVITGAEDRIREFIADAHSRGVNVEYLTGDPLWALTETNPVTGQPFNQPADNELDPVLAYNRQVAVNERFDGFQFDVEPYVLTYDHGSPYAWGNSSDLPIIWAQYLASLESWKAKVAAHNAAASDHLALGAAIPRWWDPAPGKVPDHRQVQDRVDYIAIMNYISDNDGALQGIFSELEYAEDPNQDKVRDDARGNSVYAGLDTIDITWKEDCECSCGTLYMHTASFFKNGLAALEAQVDALENAYLHPTLPSRQYRSMAGTAHHYYEDIANGETAYRNLDMGTPRNRAPAVRLLRPAAGEFFQGLENMLYTATDSDNDPLRIAVSISADNGQTWSDLPALDADNDPMAENDGSYSLDASLLATGTSYRVRVTATEDRTGGLAAFDVSDVSFAITREKTDRESPSTTGVSVTGDPSVGHPVKDFLIRWNAFQDAGSGVAGYFYSLQDPTHPEKAAFTRGLSGYLHATNHGEHIAYVWAVDRNGNLSAPVTALITVHPDLDGDGAADADDADLDGDGVANETEVSAQTNPDDARSYDRALIKGLWQFDQGSASNSLAPEFNLVKARGNIAYITNDLFYAGNVSGCLATGAVGSLILTNDITPGRVYALTVEMWLKPVRTHLTAYIPLVFDGDQDTGFSLILKNDADYLVLRLYAAGSGALGSFVGLNFDNDALFDGQWHHLACSFNGWDKQLKVYVDGVLAAQTRNRRLPAYLEHTTPMRFFDGRSWFDNDNPASLLDNSAQFENNEWTDWTGGTRFIGLFDDIRVTLAALPAEHLGWNRRPTPKGIDTDSDGMNDFDEVLIHKTDPDKPDTDADGQSDREEFLAGTDACEARSFFRIHQADDLEGRRLAFSWPSLIGRTYSLLTATSLTEPDWRTIESHLELPGNDATMTYTDNLPNLPGRYFKLLVAAGN